MSSEEYSEIKDKIKKTVDNPLFFSSVYSFLAKERKEKDKLNPDNFLRICSDEYDGISVRADATPIQESCSMRNILRTRRLANLLIDDKGYLNLHHLKRLIALMKESLYFLGPERHHDSVRQEHLLHVLELFLKQKELVRALEHITKPSMHKVAEEIIRDTLQLPEGTTLTDAHVRRAVLSALFCYLRQALGSCFATAPAILVHEEQPLLFLSDINELFSTGQLKRTFGGVEYSVPLNSSWGNGDLKRPFYVTSDPAIGAAELCVQPGLMAAFEAVGIVDADLALSQREALLKNILRVMLQKIAGDSWKLVMTSEEIIRRVLLIHFGLSEEDLEEYHNRSKTIMHGSFMLSGKGSGGKGEVCTRFYQDFGRAKKKFKSLTENALLRAWEYTLASFAETKSEFSRWNLYSSLGLNPNEDGGIGRCLFDVLKKKLDYFNRLVEEFQREYEYVFSQLKVIESKMQRAASEDEVRWVKIEYQTKLNEMRGVQDRRDEAHENAQRIASLFDRVIDFYLTLFPKYFQEVYDPEMMDVSVGPYDDSPAGFRLLYKHGRSNTSQWTPITNASEFIENLVNFFLAVERQMEFEDSFKGLGNVLSEITSEVVAHLRTDDFLESAFYRMAAAHKVPLVENPLKNMDKVEKKPWVYTSGGNMSTLVSVYFRREHPPTSVHRWVENPQELLVFFADTAKQIPYKVMEPYKINPNKSMIMHSPTHAFLFKPGFEKICNAWNANEFTYTWVRDKLIFPMERFLDDIVLNPDMMAHLVRQLLPRIPVNYQHYFNRSFGELKGSMSPNGFRDYLVYSMQRDRGLQMNGKPVLAEEEIDSLLFRELPLFPAYQLRDRVEAVLSKLPIITEKLKDEALSAFDAFSGAYYADSVIGAYQLQDICKALLCLVLKNTSFSIDYHLEVKKICVEEKFCLPIPIFFADSNWVEDYFAFVVNPGSGKLELWHVDRLALEGGPMVGWTRWLDGSRHTPDWGLYTQPQEFVGP